MLGDAICHGICNMSWYDAICLLNCVHTAWYEWHEITINDMKYNPIRIMYDLKIEEWETIWYEWWTISETIWKMIWYGHNASGVVLKDNENGKVLEPHALCVPCIRGDTPIPSRGYGHIHQMAGQRSLCFA